MQSVYQAGNYILTPPHRLRTTADRAHTFRESNDRRARQRHTMQLPLALGASWSSSSSLSCVLRCCAPLLAVAECALAAFCCLSTRGGAPGASSSSPSRPPFAAPSAEWSASSSLAPSSTYCCILLLTREGATD